MSLSNEIRKLRYRCFSWRRHPELKPSQEPIDVVLPVIAKDLRILPLCLEGIRACVRHRIMQIYVVAPPMKEIVDFCASHNLVFVDENSIFGFSPQSLNYYTKRGRNRSGWIFQQFVKLSGNVGSCRYYLCVDADHVLIHPHVFLTDKGEHVFYMSYENHKPYYDIIHRILPGLDIASLSYVDHKMLFDKEVLHRLQQAISDNNGGKEWKQVILENLDHYENSGFSEFETYGNFVTNKVTRPWLHKRLSYKRISEYQVLRSKYERWYRWSLTFPDYMRENCTN